MERAFDTNALHSCTVSRQITQLASRSRRETQSWSHPAAVPLPTRHQVNNPSTPLDEMFL